MASSALHRIICSKYNQLPSVTLGAARRTVYQTPHTPSRFGPKYRDGHKIPSSVQSVYDDILSSPDASPASATPPPIPPPEDDRYAKARIIFGSRLAGPADRRRDLDAKSRRIAGVLVPPRPEEPDNCCMSGCVNCVWDRYRDEIEEWAAKSAEARAAMSVLKTSRQGGAVGASSGAVLEEKAGSMDDDGGGSDTNWVQPLSGDPFGDIPVGIRAFMLTEKKLRERKKIKELQ